MHKLIDVRDKSFIHIVHAANMNSTQCLQGVDHEVQN